MNFEQKATDWGMEIKVTLEAPRIVDISNWPHFTIEWMGGRVTGKWLNQDAYQIGDRIFFRLIGESYDEAVVVTFDELGLEWRGG